MKPFPETVQRAFPCVPNCLPSRPWWKPDGFHAYWRKDAQKRYVVENSDQAAEADAEHPLPHPGFRAGQIWADDNGDSIVVIQCDEGEPYLKGAWWPDGNFNKVFPYLVADPACPHLAPWSPAEEK